MGSVDKCDATLPLNEMMFYVRKSKDLRERWNTDLAGLCREFGVSQAEYEALRDQDVRKLHELGVHQYYVPRCCASSMARPRTPTRTRRSRRTSARHRRNRPVRWPLP